MKILPLFLLLIVAAGCRRPVQRFVPASGSDPTLLVDTKTGRLCDGAPPAQRDERLRPCYDLYREW